MPSKMTVTLELEGGYEVTVTNPSGSVSSAFAFKVNRIPNGTRAGSPHAVTSRPSAAATSSASGLAHWKSQAKASN